MQRRTDSNMYFADSQQDETSETGFPLPLQSEAFVALNPKPWQGYCSGLARTQHSSRAEVHLQSRSRHIHRNIRRFQTHQPINASLDN